MRLELINSKEVFNGFLAFFLVQSSFCGLRLRLKAACSLCKDSHLPRTQQSLGTVFLPSDLDGLHFAQRSKSVRGFSTTLRMPDSRRRLTGRVRPFGRKQTSLREETFVPSRWDVCLFPKGRNLSTTGAPPESTSAEKGRRGRTCPRRPFSGGAFVNLSRSEVQILPRMRSMTQLVGVALTELQAQMERPRRWSTMSRRSGRCLCFGLSTRRVSSPSSVCRWMGA